MTLWAFGFATTLLLIGAWGRSASADQATLAAATRAVIDADLLENRIVEWIGDGLVGNDLPAATVAAVVDQTLTTPQVDAAIDGLIEEAVAAMLAEPGRHPTIDVATALSPAVPVVAAEMGVPEQVVATAIAGIEPLDLGNEAAAQVSETAAGVHSFLTWIVVLAGGAMVVLGTASVWLSDDRRAMVRGLLVRVALSALSFALLFRVGGWLIDPHGGRSPVLAGSSIVLRSNGHVFVGTAVAAVALMVTLSAKRRRGDRGEGTEDGDGRLAPA